MLIVVLRLVVFTGKRWRHHDRRLVFIERSQRLLRRGSNSLLLLLLLLIMIDNSLCLIIRRRRSLLHILLLFHHFLAALYCFFCTSSFKSPLVDIFQQVFDLSLPVHFFNRLELFSLIFILLKISFINLILAGGVLGLVVDNFHNGLLRRFLVGLGGLSSDFLCLLADNRIAKIIFLIDVFMDQVGFVCLFKAVVRVKRRSMISLLEGDAVVLAIFIIFNMNRINLSLLSCLSFKGFVCVTSLMIQV